MKSTSLQLFLLLLALPLFSQNWTQTFGKLGTFSSPRAIDLNQDGVKDIIMGAGQQEFIESDTTVIALDGKTGKLLWNVRASDQIFGSADFMDITGDSIPDIFIAGRSAELMAINGKDGSIIWDFYPEEDSLLAIEKELYNFYNPQFIPDQTGDGIKDLLVANGGDVTAPPYDPNRPVGHLMVIDSKTGKQIAKAPMPDGKEIYMSAIVADINNNDTLDIIYGTGGETVSGNLFRTTLDAVLKEDLSNSMHIASGENKGFIAPPALADLNQDNIKDIIVNTVDGRLLALNGVDNSVIWAGQIPNTEVYSAPAIGDINQDNIPDVFVNFAIGVWPNMKATRPLLVDGKEGKIIYMDSIGFYQMSSPLIADFNNDGFNDGLVNLNFFGPNEKNEKIIFNTLIVYDFLKRTKYSIATPQVGSNVGSTPWVGDLDDDGLIDVVYCHMTTPDKTYTYDGFSVHRIELNIKLGKRPWGAYMGNHFDGVFRE